MSQEDIRVYLGIMQNVGSPGQDRGVKKWQRGKATELL